MALPCASSAAHPAHCGFARVISCRIEALVSRGREPELAPQRRAIGGAVAEARDFAAPPERLLEQRVEAFGPGVQRDSRDRRVPLGRIARDGESARARLVHQQRRFALLGDAKSGRDIGLEGKEMKQALAEGVDRLDLQAARRLDGAREQAAREAELSGVGRRRAATDDLLREPGVV